jgi:hypothetical protein
VSSLLLVFAFAVIVGVIGPGGSDDAVVASGDAGGLGDLSGLGDSSVDDDTPADPDAQSDEVVAAAAEAMGMVTSAAFELDLDGSPVFIDQFGSIAVRSLIGQFSIPTAPERSSRSPSTATSRPRSAPSRSTTRCGSPTRSPETSRPCPPASTSIPSRFFDPEDGWQPLLANLRDVELVGIDDRGGDRYRAGHRAGRRGAEHHRRARARPGRARRAVDPPGHVARHPSRVHDLDRRRESRWVLELGRYGESFTIRPPEHPGGDA